MLLDHLGVGQRVLEGLAGGHGDRNKRHGQQSEPERPSGRPQSEPWPAGGQHHGDRSRRDPHHRDVHDQRMQAKPEHGHASR